MNQQLSLIDDIVDFKNITKILYIYINNNNYEKKEIGFILNIKQLI